MVTGANGFERGPCPTTASDTWYVPSGSTEIGAVERLVLYNPFPEDSSVDVSFATNDGRLTPGPLRGFTLPSGSVRVIDSDLMPARKTEIASILRARTGRFVVDRVQTYDGTGAEIAADGDAAAVGPPTGLASTPGITTTSARWIFPDVISRPGARTQIAIFNPSSRTAEIDLVLTYEDPARRSEIEPISLTLTGVEQRMVDLRSVPGLEPDAPFTVRLESLALDGNAAVPVVAEQVVTNAPVPVAEPEPAAGEAPPEEEEGEEGEAQEAPPEEAEAEGRRSSTGSRSSAAARSWRPPGW